MADPHAADPGSASPLPLLRRRDAIAIVVGIVIGAGIFKTPSTVAGVTGDVGWALFAWALGALISLAGALCYAELATAYPHVGGDYHYLTRAYGRHVSFLYAWARAMVINTGAIALLAFVFGEYMARVIPLGTSGAIVWAAGIVVALTAINIAGLQASARTQNVLTVIEVAGLVAVALAGCLVPVPPDAAAPALFSTSPPIGMLGLAMVFVLLTYGGWNEAAYISAELRGGRRAIVTVLVVSLAIIAAAYLAVNASLLHRLGLKGLAESTAPAAEVMQRAFGPVGANVIALAVAISALTSINATMIVGARSNCAMARDWTALSWMGGWHATRGTPLVAHLVQGLLSLALVGFGALQHDGFEAMVEFTAPVFWSFLLLVGIALFVLRAKEPHVERPFRVPLFPLTPLVFCAACAWLAWSSVTYAVSKDAVHVSLLVMAIGVVALIVTRTARANPGPGPQLRRN